MPRRTHFSLLAAQHLLRSLSPGEQTAAMAVAVSFVPDWMDHARYELIRSAVLARGGWPAHGLHSHLCFGEDDRLQVLEVWDSTEALETFAVQVLMPVLDELGIAAPVPTVLPVVLSDDAVTLPV
ncbi:MAG: hypothetical protein JWP11_2320 [Frankiales bacterium]|nr:hypothetical protein [Frankiales bacterium]